MKIISRGIILIIVIFLIAGSVVGFGLSLNYEWISGFGKIEELYPTGEKYENTEDSSSTPQKTENSDRMCFLSVIGSIENNTCDIVFTTTFDFDANKITNVFYPVDISVTKKNSDGTYDFLTLSEIYSLQGIDSLKSCVEGFLSIDISGELYMDYVNFANLISYFTSRDDGVTYNIPYTINVNNENYEKVSFSKGENVLTGSKAVQLIKFYKTYNDVYEDEMATFYNGTRFPQTEIAATFIESFISQKLIGNIDSYYNDYYLYFINKFLTEVSNNIPEQFVSKINSGYRNISSSSISTYLISYEKVSGVNFSYYKATGEVEKIVNNEGKIIKSKTDVNFALDLY